jgi:hypothetical protein
MSLDYGTLTQNGSNQSLYSALFILGLQTILGSSDCPYVLFLLKNLYFIGIQALQQ